MTRISSTSATTEIYVSLAERIAARLSLAPRARAPSAARRRGEGKDAEFCAIELEDGSIGFSYVWLGAVEGALRARPDAGGVAGMEAVALARGYASRDDGAKAVGFAAVNALSQQLFTRANWTPPAAGDSLGEIEPKAGEHIGMIGLFRPLISRVSEVRARLTVLELNPALAGEYESYRVTLDPADLVSCDKVVSTCSVMLNDTLDAVLAACRNARYLAIVGPTAGCVPDPLFARGVDAIGGRRVTDAKAFREAFCKSEKWGSFAAKYVIARWEYPGVAWLMGRAG